ncbi:MAG: hypothetical protein ICV60_16290 [Pyrinomonadaceae bacterium]|nr:hypothetical protein [Pyrinomonadaceae bacterium]
MDQSTVTVIAAVIAVLGVIGTAVASTYAVVIKGQKDREIADLKVGQDLLIEYDKDLRARRLVYYEKLLSLMLPLAKYPEPEPLTYSKLGLLSIKLRRWYFEGGGLYMSEPTSNRYFDLQDGFKIVIQKQDNRWPQNSELESLGGLKEYLKRKKVSPEVEAIARGELNMSGDQVPEEIYARLRALGSSLRTSMTEDVLTRAGTYLRDERRLSK